MFENLANLHDYYQSNVEWLFDIGWTTYWVFLTFRARRKLITAAGLCLLFMIAEIVGGVLSNSLAIATDAAHMLTDFASFLISLFAIWMAAKPKSQKMSFGWHRAEVLGATVSVLMIWLVTGVIVYQAILRYYYF